MIGIGVLRANVFLARNDRDYETGRWRQIYSKPGLC